MKPTSLAIDVGGRPLVLSSLRACFDPALRALVIADAHFGKDAVFSRARHSSADWFDRGESAAHRSSDHRVRAGDAGVSRRSAACARVAVDARARCVACVARAACVEARGARRGQSRSACRCVAAYVGCRVRARAVAYRAWALCHHPHAVDHAYVLAGHVHPVYQIATRIDSVRVPCFRFGIDRGVLPAFGSFTGGARETGRVLGERVFLVVQQRVIELRS